MNNSNPASPTTRPYERRCITCRHDWLQNEAVGDCRVFHKDVLHENVEPCESYAGRGSDDDAGQSAGWGWNL